MSGPVSRSEIALRVGLTTSAVSRLVRPLMDAGFVREVPEERDSALARPGRRIAPLDINPKGGQVLGIGIGPTFQTVTLADIKNNTIAGTELELETLDDPDGVIKQVARESRRLIGANLVDRNRLLGGLVMVAGEVDPMRGSVVSAPYLGWSSFPLRAHLADLLELPVKVRSMTATIASAERLFGETRGWDNVLTVLCGLGVAAAVILDGRLIEGSGFPRGAIGGITVRGDNCREATLDELGSGLGVVRFLHGENMTPESVPLPVMAGALRAAIERDRDCDAAIGAVMARAGRALGRVTVEFARFISPDVVLITGPLAMSPSYTAAIRETVVEGLSTGQLQIVVSAVTGPVSGRSASCAMATYEHLPEQAWA